MSVSQPHHSRTLDASADRQPIRGSRTQENCSIKREAFGRLSAGRLPCSLFVEKGSKKKKSIALASTCPSSQTFCCAALTHSDKLSSNQREPRCFPRDGNALQLEWMKEFPLFSFSILALRVFSTWTSTFIVILASGGAA